MQLLLGRRRRSIALLRLNRPQDLFQPADTTFENRYPRIFDFIGNTLGDGPDRRILSFGCSSGEEVFSIARRFPEASIKGIDINPECIRRARRAAERRPGNSRWTFVCTGSVAQEPDNHYDAVFAMAVFRHDALNSAARCDHLLRFAEFDQAVSELARIIKPGGFFAIRYATFRFTDTAAAADFTPALFIGNSQRPRNTPLFDRDNRRLPETLCDDGVYVKGG